MTASVRLREAAANAKDRGASLTYVSVSELEGMLEELEKTKAERDKLRERDIASTDLIARQRHALGAISPPASGTAPATSGREPLERAEVQAQRLGRVITGSIPHGWGFVLGLFSFGPDGFVTYISSGERASTIDLLRELATKIERKEPGA